MAKCSRTETVQYTLSLNTREAAALYEVCNRIGGTDTAVRGIFSNKPNSIKEALSIAGFHPRDYSSAIHVHPEHAAIIFTDTEY